jgi:hypothetical protein
MDFNFILLFIDSIPLQFEFLTGERMALGSDEAMTHGLVGDGMLLVH